MCDTRLSKQTKQLAAPGVDVLVRLGSAGGRGGREGRRGNPDGPVKGLTGEHPQRWMECRADQSHAKDASLPDFMESQG